MKTKEELLEEIVRKQEEKRNELVKAYSDLVTEIDKHKGTTLKEVKLRNKIAKLKSEIYLTINAINNGNETSRFYYLQIPDKSNN